MELVQRDSRGRLMAGNKLNLGRKASKETRLKMSESHMGEKNHFYGKYHTEETKQKLRDKLSGENHPWWEKKHSGRTLKKMSEIKLGEKNPFWDREHTRENKIKWSNNIQGKKNPNWRGGITPENEKLRNTFELKEWRKAVFEQDNYACVCCLTRSGNGRAVYLHAHHILGFADFPEKRFDVNNGATLCEPCHHYIHRKKLN